MEDIVEVNREILEAAKAIKDLYNTEGGEAGGYAHVVVDDENMDDETIDFCISTANNSNDNEAIKQLSLDCLYKLKVLSEHERHCALGVYEGWLTFFETKLQ